VLFLWATASKLPVALELITAWGFEYRTQLVWVKPRPVFGAYLLGQHELLLIAARGRLTPLETCRPRSVFTGKPWHPHLHSAKPDRQYEIIEGMFPGGARLELFARRRRAGWVSWGNELGRYEQNDGAAARDDRESPLRSPLNGEGVEAAGVNTTQIRSVNLIATAREHYRDANAESRMTRKVLRPLRRA
jgi:N6-adenosine-specific RNA methylase IME4